MIDLFLFGILQGNAKTNWIMIVVVGVFFLFYHLLCAVHLSDQKVRFQDTGKRKRITVEIKVSEACGGGENG